MTVPSRLLTRDEAAAWLGVCGRSIDRQKSIPRLRIGRCLLFDRRELEAWLVNVTVVRPHPSQPFAPLAPAPVGSDTAPALLRTSEAAAYVGLNVEKFGRRVRPLVPMVRAWTATMYRRADLDAFIAWRDDPDAQRQWGRARFDEARSIQRRDTVSPAAKAMLERLRAPRRKGVWQPTEEERRPRKDRPTGAGDGASSPSAERILERLRAPQLSGRRRDEGREKA